MYSVRTCYIRNLSKNDYLKIKMMCFFSNNLYNLSLYNVRQHWFDNDNKYLRYEANYHLVKNNENYKLLHTNIAQHSVRMVDYDFKTFFSLLKKVKTDNYDSKKVKLPYYKKKGGLYQLVLSSQRVRIKDGYFELPTSKTFKKIYGKNPILIKVSEDINTTYLREIRILPVFQGRYFKIQYIYKEEIQDKNLDVTNALSIDLGLDNLATCITTLGTSFIIDGRRLKSINQGWNKRKAKLQQILSKQGKRTSKLIQKITNRRNNRTNDYLKKTARYIINYCINSNIGTLIVGYNKDFKRNISLSKRINQSFTQISFGDLLKQLKALCETYNIIYKEQEESYTSKASFLDLDEIPVYNPNDFKEYHFSGKRIKRGLYKTSNNRLVNADINGSANILRKSKQNFNFEKLCRGVLVTPSRIRLI